MNVNERELGRQVVMETRAARATADTPTRLPRCGLCWGLGGWSELWAKEGAGFCLVAPEWAGWELRWAGVRGRRAQRRGAKSGESGGAPGGAPDLGVTSADRKGAGGPVRCAPAGLDPRGSQDPPQSAAGRASLLDSGTESWTELVWRGEKRCAGWQRGDK